MSLYSNRKKLISLPAQLIEIPNGIVLKRGAMEFLITGVDAAATVKTVLKATRGQGASSAQILNSFPPSIRKRAEVLIHNLVERHFLVPADITVTKHNGQESNLEIFLSNCGRSASYVTESLNRVHLVILGVNTISRQLALSLVSSGQRNYRVIDHPQHRNVQFFTAKGSLIDQEWPAQLERPLICRSDKLDDPGDCLVATSDFGGQELFCQWNRLCLNRKIIFFPVLLKNLIGYVGPIIIPGETACYECFLSRYRSNHINPQAERLVDRAAYNGQSVVGFHPSMSTILGDIASFEIARFFCDALPNKSPGCLLEVDLVAGVMLRRPVLKVPRCAACSPLNKASETNLRKVLFPEDIWLR